MSSIKTFSDCSNGKLSSSGNAAAAAAALVVGPDGGVAKVGLEQADIFFECFGPQA